MSVLRQTEAWLHARLAKKGKKDERTAKGRDIEGFTVVPEDHGAGIHHEPQKPRHKGVLPRMRGVCEEGNKGLQRKRLPLVDAPALPKRRRDRRSRGEIAFAAQLDQAGITGWVREYRFHPKRRWKFDFAWQEKKLAVEIEGGVWIQGRHNRGQGFLDDASKYNFAAMAGWVVLRFSSEQAENGFALDTVRLCV